jgi:hypothetical protein
VTEQDMQPQALRPLWRVLKDLGLTRWRHLLKWSAFLLVFAIGVAIYDAYKENERGDLTAYSLEASRVMYAGGDPYSKEMVGQNYKYLPLNAVVLGPLTLVPVPLAQGVWLSLNLGLLILCYHNHQMLLHRVKRIPWWVWIIALALTMRYTYASWKMGQWNTPVYALMFTGIVMARRSPFFGGSVIGLAGALKFMPALLVFYYAAMRDWRAFWGLMTGLVFWALVFPTLMLGPARHGELLLGFWEKSQGSYGYMMDTQSVVGESLHATLVGYLTPAPRSNVTGGGDVPFNLVELDPVLARNIVKGLMVAMFATTVMFTWWLGQVGIHKSAVGTFLLVGVWFLAGDDAFDVHAGAGFGARAGDEGDAADAAAIGWRVDRLVLPVHAARLGLCNGRCLQYMGAHSWGVHVLGDQPDGGVRGVAGGVPAARDAGGGHGSDFRPGQLGANSCR